MARPPPESEKEVADNLRWVVQPDGTAIQVVVKAK